MNETGTIALSYVDLAIATSLVAVAGIVSLGLGDAAASVVGVYFGKTSLCAGSRKTVEGAVAGAVARDEASDETEHERSHVGGRSAGSK